MGKESFLLLMQLMNDGQANVAIDKNVILDPIPIFRNSSMRNPG
jgi:LacI family transcriptional regulator